MATTVQAAVQAAAVVAQEAGSTFGYLLVLGPDGWTHMHVSPDVLAAAIADSLTAGEAAQVTIVDPVTA